MPNIRIKIGTKLIGAFLLLALFPMLSMIWLLYHDAQDALEVATRDKLTAVMTLKQHQVQEWAQNWERTVETLSGLQVVQNGLRDYSDTFHQDGQESEAYRQVDAHYQQYLTSLQDLHQCEDIYLIDKGGDIVFSTAKDADLGTNLVSGRHRASGLAQAWKNAMQHGITFTDYGHYPVQGDDSIVLFVGGPIHSAAQTVGALVVRLSPTPLNTILQERTGLGQTGETYIIGRDHLMRSDSHFEESSSILEIRVETVTADKALDGEQGYEHQTDYRGQQVASAYSPLDLGYDLGWAIFTEIDSAEALAAITTIRKENRLAALLYAFLALLATLLLAWTFRKPILEANQALNRLAEGDLTTRLTSYSKDELGDMARSMNHTFDALSHLVSTIKTSASNVKSGSEEIATGTQDLSQRTQEQAAALEETAATIEQMTATIRQNATNAANADQKASGAREVAHQGGEVVTRTAQAINDVIDSSNRISAVVDIVNELAFQTNLLALNAAVEAARAGEQGRGFAVVAQEVRNLAGRSASAAKEIQSMVNDTRMRVTEAHELVSTSGSTLKEIIATIDDVAISIAEIAAASQEQALGVEQINLGVGQMDRVVQENASMVEETSAAAENLADEARRLQHMVSTFTVRGQVDDVQSAAPAVRPAPRPRAPAPRAHRSQRIPDDFFDTDDGQVY